MDGDLSARFDALQEKLVPLWRSIEQLNDDQQTIVVVASVPGGLIPATWVPPYEERYLFLLFLLRQPNARMIYLTSQAIAPSIVDYYLDLLPGVVADHARRRLHLISPLDPSDASLTSKLLARPRLLERIRALIRDPDRAHMVPFLTTEDEMRLAVALGIPMYGAHPKHYVLGTKSRCRQLFREARVPVAAGREDLRSFDDVAAAIVEVRRERPGMRRAIAKHNDGVSGLGNAQIDLEGLPEPGDPRELDEVRRRVRALRPESEDQTVEGYEAALSEQGGIVEERLEGEEIRSPSVQMRLTPLGDLQILSTHDQVLGGASGQSYLGARFPADPAYAAAITEQARTIGLRLRDENVLGRFAVDFVVVREGERWTPHAIELNLRKGGTTHPFLTLQFLTDGTYDPAEATFTTPSGGRKHFIASDHVESPSYRALTHDDLFDLAVRSRLHFDQSSQTGVVFHMMSALPARGLTGLTAVGETPEHADELYRRTIEALDRGTEGSYVPEGEGPRSGR